MGNAVWSWDDVYSDEENPAGTFSLHEYDSDYAISFHERSRELMKHLKTRAGREWWYSLEEADMMAYSLYLPTQSYGTRIQNWYGNYYGLKTVSRTSEGDLECLNGKIVEFKVSLRGQRWLQIRDWQKIDLFVFVCIRNGETVRYVLTKEELLEELSKKSGITHGDQKVQSVNKFLEKDIELNADRQVEWKKYEHSDEEMRWLLTRG